LAGGLDGIAQARDPGKRLDVDMYQVGHTLKGIRKLPLNLLDALRALDDSKILRAMLGTPFVDSYLKLRMAEWQDYMRHLTEWERANTLDA
jgi:glutamine synthetase